MRATILFALLAFSITLPAHAQYYGNPCAYRPPQPGLIGAIVNPMLAQQQALACQQAQAAAAAQRQAQAARAQYDAQQAQAAAVARQQENERQQAVARAVAATQAKKEADARETARKVAVAAQIAAENSPDNHCRQPDFARIVIEEFNKFKPMKTLDEQVIDIEHLTTNKYDSSESDIVCHGTFITTSGTHLVGTFEMRKNVAGDPIVLWKRDRY